MAWKTTILGQLKKQYPSLKNYLGCKENVPLLMELDGALGKQKMPVDVRLVDADKLTTMIVNNARKQKRTSQRKGYDHEH